ncbi:right-handed parallel beta-helix repeat-containing protein [Candidatus Lokiarchaeum ossiferum]|uniref:right-handed parallel beta-helix repeat-containing protein n=1 Tax=Candidatus Lokiarchaeum ossiferum TaxID=2951803 RepID=UPI00352CE9EA
MKSYPKLLAIIILISSIFLRVPNDLNFDLSTENFDQVYFPQVNMSIQESSALILVQDDSDLEQFANDPYNGNSSKYPIIIENLILSPNSSSHGISIQNTTKHVLIQNCLISGINNSRSAIIIENCSNIRINMNIISNVAFGIEFDHISNVSITKNEINVSHSPIFNFSPYSNLNLNITGNILFGKIYQMCISRTQNLIFETNAISHRGGLVFRGGSNISVQNNKIDFGGAIQFSYLLNYTISNNEINSTFDPMTVLWSSDGVISNNIFRITKFDPVVIDSCHRVFVINNTITTIGHETNRIRNFWSSPANDYNMENFQYGLICESGILFKNSNNSKIINNTVNNNRNGIVLLNSVGNLISNNFLNVISNKGIYSDEPKLNTISDNEINSIKIWKEDPIFISYFIVFSVIYIVYLLYQNRWKNNSDIDKKNAEENIEENKETKELVKKKKFQIFKNYFAYIYFVAVPPILILIGYFGFGIYTSYLYSIGFLVMIGIIFILKKLVKDLLNSEIRKGEKNRLTIFIILNLVGGLLGIVIFIEKIIEMLGLIQITPKFILIDFNYYFHVIWFSLPLIFLFNPLEIKALLKRDIPSLEVT